MARPVLFIEQTRAGEVFGDVDVCRVPAVTAGPTSDAAQGGTASPRCAARDRLFNQRRDAIYPRSKTGSAVIAFQRVPAMLLDLDWTRISLI
jgi:hypothetical protein